MPVFRLRENEISFPYPTQAREDGLLAVGGDLSVDRLLLAYSHGIFPWFQPGEEILWWCPKERYLIFPAHIHVSRSMKKYRKQHAIHTVLNRDFRDTMHQCRMQREDKEGTWIGDEMEAAYQALHRAGFALSLEAYEDGQLAGGLYGVVMGACFFGESMFSKKTNGSKLALIALAELLEAKGFLFIDCQFYTEHLCSMGGQYVSWEAYEELLKKGLPEIIERNH